MLQVRINAINASWIKFMIFLPLVQDLHEDLLPHFRHVLPVRKERKKHIYCR